MVGGAEPASVRPRPQIKTTRRPGRPDDGRREEQSGVGDDSSHEEPPTRRRRVALAAVQHRTLVAIAGTIEDDKCWGCGLVFSDGGFCDEYVTELQEQCAQEDVRLPLCSRSCAVRRRNERWGVTSVTMSSDSWSIKESCTSSQNH